MLTIGDFNSFWVFLGHPVYQSTVCPKKKGYPLRLGSQTLMQHVRDRMF